MLKTDWDEITAFYNGVFGTKFKTGAAVRRSCLKRFDTIYNAADKLGVSSETLRLQMIEDGSKIPSQGSHKRK